MFIAKSVLNINSQPINYSVSYIYIYMYNHAALIKIYTYLITAICYRIPQVSENFN